ncbi:MAG: cobalt-precorrin 5A hydrolase [Oscillibacter sp.]|nr:cobalt-precorrin 5A hydrolase [Oscillibacter sp.]
MSVWLLSFTEEGFALARRLAEGLRGKAARCGAPLGLAEWTDRAWEESEALVFVGAAGIAVRAIAPHVRSKAADPAVVVVDEGGRFAVPILSGHLGGANDLARKIAALCGAEPVITTATDVRGVFAVDEWAKRQNCRVENPEAIRRVSAKVLSGGTIGVFSPWPIAGRPPEHAAPVPEEACDVLLTIRRAERDCLRLIPAAAVLGVGCKKGAPLAALEAAFVALLNAGGLHPLAFAKVCSIDRKREEPGLLDFCAAYGFALETYSAQKLQAVEGSFSSSDFVQGVMGVDNVCERSAVLGSGGTLLVKRQAGGGVTMAAALAPVRLDWRWNDG